MAEIKLHQLASAAGVPARTLARWADAGMVRATKLGRGRGNGTTVTRDAAIEALALAMLRRAGVPLERLRATVQELRRARKSGPAFLALGADGRTILLDGSGDGHPLRDPRTGQTYLGVVVDLRPMRGAIGQLVNQLASRPGGA